MGMVEVDDQRAPIAVPSIVSGLVAFGVIAFLGGNVFTLFLVPAAIFVLFKGKKVERQGADRTIVIQRRERTPKVLKTAAYIMVASAVFSLLSLQFGWLFVSLLAAGALWALAHHRAGGVWPWEDKEADPYSEYTAEDWALHNAGDEIFRQTGLYTKSSTTGLPVYPDVLNMGRDEKGRVFFEFRVLSGQQTVEDIARKAPNIASAWDVPRVVVTEPEPHIARCTAIIHESRISGPVLWSPRDARMPVADYVRNLPMGADVAEGEPWNLDLAERNFVISGQPGSGKSSFANALLAHLGRHRDVRIAFIDLKIGAEAAQWKGRADTIVRNSPRDQGQGVEDAIDFINAAMDEIGDRYERMIDRGITNAWTEGFLGADEPVKVLVVDECSRLFRDDTKESAKRAERALSALQEYVEQGRAAGYVLVISTQYPTTDNLPTRIRNNVSDRIAFKSSDQGMAATLGQSYAPTSALVDPTRISKTEAGQAVIVGDDGEARRIQMAWLDNDEKKKIVAATSHLRHESWLDAPPPPPPSSPESKRGDTPPPPRGSGPSEDAVDAELEELLKGLDLD